MLCMRRVVFITLILLLVLLIMVFYGSNLHGLLEDKNIVAFYGEDISISGTNMDMSYGVDYNGNSKTYDGRVHFVSQKLNNIVGNSYSILIYSMGGQAYQVYLNGYLIGSVGDFQSGNSTIRNNVDVFTFDSKLIKENNVLEIKNFSWYDYGIKKFPLVIGDSLTIENLQNKILRYTIGLVTLFRGICFSTSVILICIFTILKRKKFLFLSAGFLFLALYLCTDIIMPYYHYFFLYEQVSYGLLFPGICFIIMGILNHNKFQMFTSICLSLMLIGIIVSQNFKALHLLVNLYYVIIMILALYMIYYLKIYNKSIASSKAIIMTQSIFLIYFVYLFITNDAFDISILYMGISIILSNVIFISWESIEEEKETRNSIYNQSEMNYELSIRDYLTDTYNRRYMNSIIKDKKPPFIVTMIDLDNFKNINDELGHVVGDETLIKTTNIIKQNFRNSDIVCRYGGDEFLIIAEECTIENILDRLNSINDVLKTTFTDLKYPLTLSAGVYQVIENEEVNSIINKVDSCLYEAKRGGKSQFCIGNA